MSQKTPINGDDLWVKVVEMLQQNCTSIERNEAGFFVYFISDASAVFVQMHYGSVAEA